MTCEEIKAQYRKENPLLAEAVDIAIKMVTDMDMVEVVRCENCIHDDKCRIQDYLWGYDDYCSRGERKVE